MDIPVTLPMACLFRPEPTDTMTTRTKLCGVLVIVLCGCSLSARTLALIGRGANITVVTEPSLIFSVNTTNWVEIQSFRIYTAGPWKSLTNGYGALAVTFATLNLLTNPIVGYANSFQWNPTADPIVAGTDLLAWKSGGATNVTDCGGNTNGTVTLPAQGVDNYAAVHYSLAGVWSPLSNIVIATNRIVQPPVALLFRAKQTNGVAPVLNWKVVDL